MNVLKWVTRQGELQEQNQAKNRLLGEEVVLNSICWKSVGKVSSQYLELILVNFSPATFSCAHRIFIDKVRPDNVLLLVFYTSNQA